MVGRALITGMVLFVAVVVAGGLWATWMPGKSHSTEPSPLGPEGERLTERLRAHVRFLAEEIGPRHVGEPGSLHRAAEYVAGRFRQFGHEVGEKRFTVRGRELVNLEAEIRGRSSPGEIILVGAHYDSVPGSPGADDNASGVAALLELARRIPEQGFARTVRLVAFPNEEMPFFGTPAMGSDRYARQAAERGEDIRAMFCLESVGFYSEESGSQNHPFPLGLVYPDRGDFVGFVANLPSGGLLRRSVATFRSHAEIASQGLAAPGWVTGVSWSDHASFWRQGYAAVMITDTALFRNPHYHEPTDVPRTLDFERMARLVTAFEQVIRSEAGAPAEGTKQDSQGS